MTTRGAAAFLALAWALAPARASASDGAVRSSTRAFTAPAMMAWTSTAWQTVDKPLLVFFGNAVINEETYRAILDLPRSAEATRATAELVSERLLDLLRRAGYELATVSAAPSGEQIFVEMDEGRLDKVVVRGQGVFGTLQLKLGLSLPFNVFNRPLLERQLEALKEELHIQSYRWEIVPVERPEESGPQLQTLGVIQRVPLLLPGRPYELHIFVERDPWVTGLSPELALNGLEGLALGALMRGKGMAFEQDRWTVSGRAAMAIRNSVDPGGPQRPVISRVAVGGVWFTPPLVGEDFRLAVDIAAYLLHRQRDDLGLESYYSAEAEAAVKAQYAFEGESTISAGLGLEQRVIFALEPAMTVAAASLEEVRRTRPYAEVGIHLLLSPSELRIDRAHTLDLSLRVLRRQEEAGTETLRINAEWKRTQLFGWHELRLSARGFYTAGDVLFPDEASVGGEHLRGPFGDDYYTTSVSSFSAEMRWSLARDVVKVGVFHDVALFGALDEKRVVERAAIANAFGPSLHVLVIDSFQIDAYAGFGFASDGSFDNGFALAIRQAY